MVKATKDHNGRFGVIEAGQEYDPEVPVIKRAIEEAPELFEKPEPVKKVAAKKVAKKATRKVETAQKKVPETR